MKKYNLTSDLGYFFVLTSNVMGIGIIGFFIFSLATLNVVASLLCFSFGFFYCMRFYRHTRKFINVYFDDNYLYYKDQVLPLEKILEIGEKKIVVEDDSGTQEILYFNYFFSNINLLKKYINSTEGAL